MDAQQHRDRDCRILQWISSVPELSLNTQGQEVEHCAKRPRLHFADCQPDAFANPYNTAMPDTPPLTGASDPSVGGRKRGADAIDESEGKHRLLAIIVEATPKARLPIRKFPSLSPKKNKIRRSRSTSPTKLKFRSHLEMFEKPIYVEDLQSNIDNLPEDVKQLYRRVRNLEHHREGIIPREVRQEVTALLGEDDVRDHNFRQEATEGAEAAHTHASLLGIVLEAQAAAKYQYHGTGWNHCVHTPLLKLVYSSIQPSREPARQPSDQQPASARVVPVVSVSVPAPYVPTKHMKLHTLQAHPLLTTTGDVGPWSSASSAPSDGSSSTSQSTEDVSGQVSSRSNNKKVDYVLAIDAAHTTPLQKLMSIYVHNEAIENDFLPHVNHVIYPPLQWSPIACSVETKVESAAHDPMLQLGTWVASWHKRLGILRQYVFENSLRLQPDDLLPPALLLEVVNHEWRLYFAYDRGTSIVLYGPLSVGSTRDLIEAYILIAVLKVIKGWM